MKPKNAGRIATEAEAERSRFPEPEWAFTYGLSGWRLVRYNPAKHRFYAKWPYPLTLYDTPFKCFDGAGNEVDKPALGYVCFKTGFHFKERLQQLKNQGWHNSGPEIEKKCFMFSQKSADGVGNKPLRIALRFDGDIVVWALGTEDKKSEITDQLINMISLINN